MQNGFSFDLSRCSGCMACVVACMDQNDIPGEGPSYRQVIQVEKGEYPSPQVAWVTLACFHCADAPCIQVCPKGAIFRNEEQGVVDVHEELCIGCHTCATVCPYGAPQFLGEGKMSKCDLCVDRVSRGLEPACVHTCTTRALGFGSMKDLAERKAEKASLKILDSLLTASPRTG